MEEDVIIGIWDTFKEYVPEKNRENAAAQFIDFLLGRDVELSVIENLAGFDPHLDSAIELVVDEEGGYDSEEDEEDRDRYEEDEDY
jgi:hypothetical protein